MYTKLNITENSIQILSLFTRGFDKEYYIREVGRMLKLSPRTAQLILDDLEKKAVLESYVKGKIRVYRLKRTEMSRHYLILAEQYKAVSFFEKNMMIREVKAKIIPYIEGIGLIFGSYAKGLAKKDSDLDVFVAGNCDFEQIEKVGEQYNIHVSVKQYPLEVFEKEKDTLIREVLENHIVFVNTEQFIRAVVKSG